MDGIWLKVGLLATPSAPSVPGTLGVRKNPAHVSALGRSATTVNPISRDKPSPFSLGNPWKFVWRRGKQNEDLAFIEEERKDEDNEDQKENWILKILRVNYRWTKKDNCGLDMRKEDSNGGGSDKEDEEIEVSRVYEDDEKNKNSFSKLLRKVTLAEAKLYAQMSHLGSLAYKIPKIKAENLMKYSGLRFVTSSKEVVTEVEDDEAAKPKPKPNAPRINASSAYRIVASAAAYLQSHAKGVIPLNFHGDDLDSKKMNRDMASLVATADSVTAVVAAEEEVKQAVANDLKSTRSSPCEWFICDEDRTRFFVIQGSESLASWQANLLFEPVRFEELEFLVHRGIYELAKRIYEHMLPAVRSHLKIWKDRARFRFTGHSLGGSLGLLVSLMLVTRGEVPPFSLLPVITFGSPTVMCGGNRLLRQLGLPRSHLQSITMHRDIVPRAFSCNYPAHVARLLRVLNKNFRNHPCLDNQKLLYSPMGELLILQPDAEFSPNHHLLPPGSGLYILSCPNSREEDDDDDIGAAQRRFLNSPHPLEILSDRSAYGSDGSIHKHHDLNSYMKSVRSVICKELSRIRKAERERRRNVWWPLLLQRGPMGASHVGLDVSTVSFFMQLGRESMKRFANLFASRQMNLLVVLLFPAPFLVFGPFGAIRIR